MSSAPAILLVHGSWHGAWYWDPIIPLLAAQGRRVETVNLPTVHDQAKVERGMGDDVAHVRAAIEAIEGPVVVVAHSYGGIPVTVAAAGSEAVQHLVYLSAFVLDVNESLLGAVGGTPPGWLTVADGLVSAGSSVATAAEVLYHDLDDDVADEALGRLASQSLNAFIEPVTATAWSTIPSTYVVTQDDRAIPAEAQEAMASRSGGAIVRLPTGHSAVHTAAHEVAELVLGAGA